MDRSLLSNATSQDDAPTAGYMLAEISKATLANYQANVQLQEYLVSRLTHKHHNVKYKCLVIIKHVCRTGRPEFKREMAKKVDTIKECLQFRGPPDPLRGDEIYKRVRDAAKEALDAIFDSQMPITTSAVAQANRIQGMGNDYVPADQLKKESGGILSSFVSSVTSVVMGDGTDPVYAGHPGAEGSFIGGADKQFPTQNSHNSSYTAPGGGGSGQTIFRSGSSGMTGLGNPNFKDARDEKSWYQKAGEVASSISGISLGSSGSGKDPGSHNFQSNNPEWSYASNRGTNAYNTGQEGYQPQRTNALGSNVNNFQQWQQRAGGSGLVTSQTSQVVPDLPPANGLGSGRVGGGASDGSYERGLIESLCEPGGLKAIPQEAKLQDFLSSAPNLSAELVGDVLLDVLNSDSWQSRVKALIVIGHLIQTKDCDAHKDWWRANHEEVRALCNDGKAGVRNQASKTYKILTGTVVNVSTGNVGANPAEEIDNTASLSPKLGGSSRKEESLLDMLDDVTSYNAPAPVPAPAPSPLPPATNSSAPAPSSSGLDLFSGLAVSSSTSAQPSPLPAAPVSILNTLQSSPPPPVPAPAPAPVNNSNAISNSFDFLSDDLTAPAPAPPVPPPVSDGLFSGMNMGANPTPNPNPNPNLSPNNRSQSQSIIDDFAGLSSSTPLTMNYSQPPPSSSGGGGGFSFINNNSNSNGNTSYNNSNNSMNNRGSITVNPASSSAISSAFSENSLNPQRNNNNNNSNDSFSQLVNLGNGSSSSSSSSNNNNSSGRYTAPPPLPHNAVPVQALYPGQPVPGYGRYPVQGGGVAPVAGYGQPYPGAPQPNYGPAAGYPVNVGVNPAAAPNGMPGYVNPTNSVLAPGMLSPMAPRKNIPTADAVGGPSGFAFLGGAGGGGAPNGGRAGGGGGGGGNDSFNFVSDAMKDMKK